MGTGRYSPGKFDFTAVANFVMTAADLTQWQRALEKTSELLWNATEGQAEFGRIFICDDSVGIETAEMILHPTGDPSYATLGGFGQPGKAMNLMPYVKTQPLTILHELGHHAWSLGEEYADTDTEDIDTSAPAPDNSTIPLVGSAYADDDLVGADAIIGFPTSVERREITANDATSVTVSPAFSDLPTNDTNGITTYQFEAECATADDAEFCIMENSRGAAGEFDAAGVWVPATDPVTEFCTDSNHDPDGDTQQERTNGDSCWEHLVTVPGFGGLAGPDPANPVAPGGDTVPELFVLDKQPRFAVVLDRSGSMGTGNKMTDAHHGATYWLEFCSLDDDLLTVIGYDHIITPVFDLADVASLGSLTNEIDDIEALTPAGATNIRDALFEARNQITSLPTRAAVQVVLLLTDGVHNSPFGSSATEALPTLQEDGIRVYALGVGNTSVDMATLEALADGTGGRSYAVGDDEPGLIEAAMMEINAEVRGGIITTTPELFPDSGSSGVDELLGRYGLSPDGRENRPVSPRKRPKLEEILRAVRTRGVEDLIRPDRRVSRRKRRSARLVSVAVDVEPGAKRASFAVAYPDTENLWLYLVDPNGDQANAASPRVHHVVSSAPHEFIVVDNPLAGRWHVVALRTTPGATFTSRFVAGSENPSLQAFGSAVGSVRSGPATLRASARWGHELSHLRVSAEIRDPRGATTRVVLHDDTSRPNDGDYRGHFDPKVRGRHTGIITIENAGGATRADPFGLMLHAPEGTDSVSLATETPRFVRRVPFSFHVGPEPEIEDGEDPAGKSGERVVPRPQKLKSAKLRRHR